jgi:quercetin dioxygenase-like cupin family protein
MKAMYKGALSVLAGVGLGAVGMQGLLAGGQKPEITGVAMASVVRTDLLGSSDQLAINTVEAPAGAAMARHSHNGVEYHYILSGEWEFKNDGDVPVVLKAGQGQFVPRGRIYTGKVVSSTPAKFLIIFVADKDKPLSVANP